jgi:hypothetical protein
MAKLFVNHALSHAAYCRQLIITGRIETDPDIEVRNVGYKDGIPLNFSLTAP